MSELMEILGLSRSDAERLWENNSMSEDSGWLPRWMQTEEEATADNSDYYLSSCLLRGC